MSPAPERKVTVADVAAEAGVSVATVSKVLNGRPDVASDTRTRIEAILSARGYVPTKRTRRAATTEERRGGLVEMLFNDPSTPWAAEMIRGAELTARAARVGIVVSVRQSGSKGVQQWLDDVEHRGSRGIVLALSDFSPADQKRVAKLGLPTVLVDPVGDFDTDLPSIGAGNWGGGMAATRHLLELGHRRIGIITGPMRFLCSQARLAGYRVALERAGVGSDPSLIAHGDFHHASGLASAAGLLDLPEPPTAIFAANDEQGTGVYAAIQQRGLRIPHDISVVGFDDVPMSQWVSPPLTTVRQPIAELAALAIRAALSRPGAPELPQGRMELSTSLIVRESTAPPRTG
ncbi:LacI family DNA-binding transcriptional regulator [Pseudonocardia sp. MH-G8]|uniref:LacI family DNA-binding transcriptional regulator n=1 Tax=Pseudonocardia sp. MH-G8 TaxID=1854588 RepID=UPI000B9FE985|nr:LacI family DNA-binding transcriptional regulator [Pseudonocardia sp. MH-G8]OZM84243.1 LacI family transcriptional regulator [Pseudonocardia sp. MH-G8]